MKLAQSTFTIIDPNRVSCRPLGSRVGPAVVPRTLSMNPQSEVPATPDPGTIQVATVGPEGAVVTAPAPPVGGQGPQVAAPQGETQQEALGVGTEGEETV